MEMKLTLAVYLLCLTAFVHSETTSLQISPAKTHLLVMKGDKLQIDCIQEYTDKTVDDMAVFKKHIDASNTDEIITMANKANYGVDDLRFESVTSGSTVTTFTGTLTLTVNSAGATSAGKYTCHAGSGLSERTSSTTVAVVTLTTEDGTLPANVTSSQIELGCRLEKNLPASVNEWSYTWKHGDKELAEGDKYKISNNGSLFIMDAKREDMGEYMCTVVFFPSSTVEKHSMTPRAVFLKAGPAIDHHDNNKNMVQGDKLELNCEASGYPVPTVTWFKNNVEMNATTRIHFLQYKSTPTGMLQIFDLDYADEADYKCVASNEVAPGNATAVMKLRVKDKLAALWPFLGIVAEVIILCVIILVYEKRRSKKLADEDDSADGNVENTVDNNRDVRHRRT